MKHERLGRLTTASLLLAVGLILPTLTGQIKEIGDSLLPMHLPVMLCGALCGGGYGALIGAVLPCLRSLLFGMPPIYPNAVWMAAELLTYGGVLGLLFKRRLIYSRRRLCISLAISMVAGRIVWGVTKAALLGVASKPFGLEAFLVGGFLDAIPGIILQWILIPIIIEAHERISLKRRIK